MRVVPPRIRSLIGGWSLRRTTLLYSQAAMELKTADFSQVPGRNAGRIMDGISFAGKGTGKRMLNLK